MVPVRPQSDPQTSRVEVRPAEPRRRHHQVLGAVGEEIRLDPHADMAFVGEGHPWIFHESDINKRVG